MNAATMAVFLRAVALVESGGDERAVGEAGERGQFQMTPAVVASCGGYGAREAAHYAHWIELQLVRGGHEPLPFNVALAWNAGAGSVLRGEAPVSSYAYARRVQEIMEQISGENIGIPKYEVDKSGRR